MRPFIELPVVLAGGDKQPEKHVIGRWMPDEIAGYVPAYYSGCIVHTKSGFSFIVTMSCEQLDNILMQYRIALKKNNGKNMGNLAILPESKN